MLTLGVAFLVVFAPGAALLLALGVTRPVWWLGLTPAASFGVATVTASICGVTGLPYGPPALAVATIALAALGSWKGKVRIADLSFPRSEEWPGIGLIVIGVGIATATWLRGMGSLATILQEHDMILHGVMTSYVDRTGDAAPWQLMPADVVTGDGITFYPSGLHQLASVVASLRGGDATVGINAITVLTLGVGWASGSAALGYVAARQARVDRAPALVVAGVAAIVAAGLFRPTIALVQFGGIVANALTLALAPGLLAALVSMPRGRDGWPYGAAAGVGCAGLFVVHPSAALTIGVSLAAWWLGTAVTRDGRDQLRAQLVPLATLAGAALVVALPTLLAMFDLADQVSSFAPDIRSIGFVDAVGRTVGLAYNRGEVGEKVGQTQLAAAMLYLVGVAVLVVTRRGLGIVAAWLAWVGIVVAFWVSPGSGPHGLITNVFYDAQIRVWSHVSLFVPALAGLGVVLVATFLAEAISALTARARSYPRYGAAIASPGRLARLLPRDGPAVAIVIATAISIGYVVGPARGYARSDTNAVASRYKDPVPGLIRFSDDDRQAAAWLASQVNEGERVLNSGNDGSTLLYTEHDIPIVNVSSLGSSKSPPTYRLLQRFNRFPEDEDVRRMLRDLNVRWVYVDSEAPGFAANGAPEAWTNWLTVPEGFAHLEGLRGLSLEFQSGTVSVYRLTLPRP